MKQYRTLALPAKWITTIGIQSLRTFKSRTLLFYSRRFGYFGMNRENAPYDTPPNSTVIAVSSPPRHDVFPPNHIMLLISGICFSREPDITFYTLCHRT